MDDDFCTGVPWSLGYRYESNSWKCWIRLPVPINTGMLIRNPAHSGWKTETTGKLEFNVWDPDPHGSALFLGSRFTVRMKVKSWIWNRITVRSGTLEAQNWAMEGRGRPKMRLKNLNDAVWGGRSRNRVRIRVKIRIRIRMNVMRICNPGYNEWKAERLGWLELVITRTTEMIEMTAVLIWNI